MGFEILVTKCQQGGAGSKIPRLFFGDIIFLWSLNKHNFSNAWVGKIKIVTKIQVFLVKHRTCSIFSRWYPVKHMIQREV